MTSRHLASAVCAALTLATASAAAAPAWADQFASEAAPNRVISVPRDKSLSFRLDEPATKIVVAQPDIAEVVATTDRSFYVRGLDLGSTNLLVYGPGGRLMQVIDVRVGVDAAAVEHDLMQILPGEHIKVQSLGDGIVLTGTASNPGIALRAKAIADKLAPDAVTSMIQVADTQVVLEVRILEADRNVAQDLGVGATAANSRFNFAYGSNLVGDNIAPNAGTTPVVGLIGNSEPAGALRVLGKIGTSVIDSHLAALEEKGMVRTLARPNLVAMSGEKASFLAGGEFPFPVPAGQGLISVEFRQYGVKLDFTPSVQDNGKIKMTVAPEVSALDPTNTVRVDNVTIPALTVRKANTTVELKSGDSLAIGGLFQHNAQTDIRQLPGLGSIPILSALFRSTRYQRNETELLIIVTPKVVTQADIDADKNRTISGTEPGMASFLLNGEALDKPLSHDFNGPVEPAPAKPVAEKSASKPTQQAQADPAPILPQLRGEIAPPTPLPPAAPATPASGK